MGEHQSVPVYVLPHNMRRQVNCAGWGYAPATGRHSDNSDMTQTDPDESRKNRMADCKYRVTAVRKLPT